MRGESLAVQARQTPPSRRAQGLLPSASAALCGRSGLPEWLRDRGSGGSLPKAALPSFWPSSRPIGPVLITVYLGTQSCIIIIPERPVHVITRPAAARPPPDRQNFSSEPPSISYGDAVAYYADGHVTSIPPSSLVMVADSSPLPSSLPLSAAARPPSHGIAHVLSFHSTSSTEHSSQRIPKTADRHGPFHLHTHLCPELRLSPVAHLVSGVVVLLSTTASWLTTAKGGVRLGPRRLKRIPWTVGVDERRATAHLVIWTGRR
jgi:hypothetical protein